MSSFFTLPKSQKRKRNDVTASTPKKPRTGGGAPPASRKSRASLDDDSISGSNTDLSGDEGYESARSDFSDERETAAENRLRLAEEYLESVRKETEQEVGFDAEEIDRDLIAERLKEDVAESKGKLYRRLASTYNWCGPLRTFFSAQDDEVTTAVASNGSHVFTATKDMRITRWKIPKTSFPSSATDSARSSSPHPELSKAKRRKLREKRRIEQVQKDSNGDRTWKQGLLKIRSTRGSHRMISDKSYKHHVAPILCLACSPNGQLLVSGGADRRLIVWDAEKLTPKRVFTQHRDAVTGLAFRRNTNQLFSASADRTIKVWSLDELAYVETLFGHQDEVIDVASLGLERCVSVGGRDRTARVWKVVEESQLVFRGGASAANKENKSRKRTSEGAASEFAEQKSQSAYGEGSIDCVALIDDEMFVTGSDNGNISLWNVQKKKPVHTVYLAHGLDPPLAREQAFADLDLDQNLDVPGPPLPRWITSLVTVPYSDLVVSGSWDGCVRIWRISEDKKRLEALGGIGEAAKDEMPLLTNGTYRTSNDEAIEKAEESSVGKLLTELEDISELEDKTPAHTVKGVVNDLVVFEEGERGKETLYILAGTGREHRLGKWFKRPGRNGAHLFAVTKTGLMNKANEKRMDV